MQAEVLRRIHARIWAPGEMIPNEQELAREFGCARATVNRALQSLSETGLLERRRKAGTRVALHPVRKATLEIPIIRQEIESLGQVYGYRRLASQGDTPSEAIREQFQAGASHRFLRVKSVQTADGTPFVYEDRWINLTAIPGAQEVDFGEISANEWLLTTAPYTHGEISFFAINASAEVAQYLEIAQAVAIFSIERTTWDNSQAVTTVQQFFQPGYRMQTSL